MSSLFAVRYDYDNKINHVTDTQGSEEQAEKLSHCHYLTPTGFSSSSLQMASSYNSESSWLTRICSRVDDDMVDYELQIL